jgi:hypothetical protein
MAKDVAWLAQQLENRGYRQENPSAHVHDGKTRFLLVRDAKAGNARWCSKRTPLAETIHDGETAYACPDEIWWEFTMALPSA